jgi:hypothetical protein
MSTPVLALESGVARMAHRLWAKEIQAQEMDIEVPVAAVRWTRRSSHVTVGFEVSEPSGVSRGAHGIIALLRAFGLLTFTVAMLLGRPVAAQEPIVLTGTWVGTWWIGKYEEPIELDLTHTDANLVGHVTIWNYPRLGFSGAAATPVRAPVEGTVEGDRVQLTWAMPEHGRFRAELTLLTRTTLFGLGGPGQITTGFELSLSP